MDLLFFNLNANNEVLYPYHSFSLEGLEAGFEIGLFNGQGAFIQRLDMRSVNSFSVKELVNGVYFVKITDIENHRFLVKKLVKW